MCPGIVFHKWNHSVITSSPGKCNSIPNAPHEPSTWSTYASVTRSPVAASSFLSLIESFLLGFRYPCWYKQLTNLAIVPSCLVKLTWLVRERERDLLNGFVLYGSSATFISGAVLLNCKSGREHHHLREARTTSYYQVSEESQLGN